MPVKKVLIFLFLLIMSCSQQNNKESKIVMDYLSRMYPTEISSGNIILINSLGCHSCIENGINFLEQNNLYGQYKAIVISNKVVEELDNKVNEDKFIIDKENQLEKLNISHSGFVIIKLNQSIIDTIFSLNPKIDLNILKKVSRSEVSSLHRAACAACMQRR